MDLIGPRFWFIPVAIAIGIAETVVLHRRRNDPRYSYSGYSIANSLMAAWIGAGAQAIGIGYRLVLVYGSALLAPFAPFQIHGAVLDFLVALVAWDICFYWFHRLSHRTRLGWASHVVHHDSDYFNLTVALRLEWFPFLGIALYPLVALMGVSREASAAAVLVNGFHAGMVHTELVDRFPRPIEWLFNTPSHHRVHHQRAATNGSNFGNMFIVWDRLFGTFEAATDGPRTYGVEGLPPSRLGLAGAPLDRFYRLFLRPTWRNITRNSAAQPAGEHRRRVVEHSPAQVAAPERSSPATADQDLDAVPAGARS